MANVLRDRIAQSHIHANNDKIASHNHTPTVRGLITCSWSQILNRYRSCKMRQKIKEQLLISVATTEMLCHLDISLSSAFSVVMVPLAESMANSLSRSVWRSMMYLNKITEEWNVWTGFYGFRNRHIIHSHLRWRVGGGLMIALDP